MPLHYTTDFPSCQQFQGFLKQNHKYFHLYPTPSESDPRLYRAWRPTKPHPSPPPRVASGRRLSLLSGSHLAGARVQISSFSPTEKATRLGGFSVGGDGEILSCRSAAAHLANIVALFPVGLDAPCLLTRSPSLLPPPSALGSLPLAGARVQFSSFSPTEKATRLGGFSVGGDERFCLAASRRRTSQT